MNRLGHQLFPGTRVALNEDRGIGGGDPPQPIDHVVHLRAVADHPFESKFLIEPTA